MHPDIHDVAFSAEDANVCYVATDGGMYRSEDAGNQWEYRSRWLVTTQLYSVAVSDQGSFLLAGATQDVGIIVLDSPPHTRPTTLGPEGGIVVIDPNDSNTVFATPFLQPLARTTDRGVHWFALRTGLPAMSAAGMPGYPGWINHLAVQPQNSRVVLAAADNGIYKSTDQGDSWQLVLDVSPAGASRVAFSPKDPAVAYAAVANGTSLWRNDRSGDVGSWNAFPLPHFGTISALAPDWNDPNIIWVGYNYPAAGARIWRFDSGRPYWQQASGSPPNALVSAITSLVADQNNASNAYACTELGVFRTTDYGQSWQPLNDGLPSVLTTQVALHRPTNTLYASTFGRGFWHRQL